MATARRPESSSFIGAVQDEWELFSDRADDYTLGLPIGFGASSTVYAAVYKPHDQPSRRPVPCALKVLDLDRLPRNSLNLLQRETQLMSLSKHPNVLRVRGSWQDGHKICIALRLMNSGSAADVMRYGWPGGMEEEVVRCILKQALEGLNYLHVNGFIHRDVKAANLLIDDDGTVLLGDLGVAAPLHDEDHSHGSGSASPTDTRRAPSSSAFPHPLAGASSSSSSSSPLSTPPRKGKLGKRRSFVGTPAWMAPELISGKHYDSSADIWSFGITALELAQGRAPRSRESPSAVLLQTVHSASPTLNREGGVHKYSRAFKEVVDACLVKDPALRPTAEQLLQLPFFKNAKRKPYLVNTILRGLPALTKRLERRRTPSVVLQGTVDSWDFTATLHHQLSPGASGMSTHSPTVPEHEAPPSVAGSSQDESDRASSGAPSIISPMEPSVVSPIEPNNDVLSRHEPAVVSPPEPNDLGGVYVFDEPARLKLTVPAPASTLSGILPPSPGSEPASLSESAGATSSDSEDLRSERPVNNRTRTQEKQQARGGAQVEPEQKTRRASVGGGHREGLWDKIKDATKRKNSGGRLRGVIKRMPST